MSDYEAIKFILAEYGFTPLSAGQIVFYLLCCQIRTDNHVAPDWVDKIIENEINHGIYDIIPCEVSQDEDGKPLKTYSLMSHLYTI